MLVSYIKNTIFGKTRNFPWIYITSTYLYHVRYLLIVIDIWLMYIFVDEFFLCLFFQLYQFFIW